MESVLCFTGGKSSRRLEVSSPISDLDWGAGRWGALLGIPYWQLMDCQ